MDLGLAGKRALVTGSGRGIGQACALALAREGCRVMLCARSENDLLDTVEAMGGRECGHDFETLDLVADDGPARLAAVAGERFGQPDIVVHNLGGTLNVREPLAPASDWRAAWRLNVEVAIELTNALLPAMCRQGWGRIVFVSSLAAFEQQGSLAYGVTKAAITAYARGIGRLFARDGVVVSAIVPGVVVTRGGTWERYRREDPEGVARYVSEKLPRGAFGTAEEIADAVVFLASERAGAFSGSLIPMDGGQGVGTFGQ